MRFKYFTLAAALCASLLSAAPYETIEEKGKLPILTPAFRDQKTAKIRLPNGLEAYLISNPDLNLSGAMMSVNVGSWEDPQEYPGLAHFLEHMLFMGTRAYPDESEYSRLSTKTAARQTPLPPATRQTIFSQFKTMLLEKRSKDSPLSSKNLSSIPPAFHAS